jgi:DeoR family transcriptional regulator of aga operon
MEADAKRAIGRSAAALVEDGGAIALDDSTTSYYLALELRKRSELAVVTNGLRAAEVFASSPSVTVLLSGGTVRASSLSVVPPLVSERLSEMRVGVAFVSSHGFDVKRGLVEMDHQEVEAKRL